VRIYLDRLLSFVSIQTYIKKRHVRVERVAAFDFSVRDCIDINARRRRVKKRLQRRLVLRKTHQSSSLVSAALAVCIYQSALDRCSGFMVRSYVCIRIHKKAKEMSTLPGHRFPE
jgi:hypothetical protein